MATLMVHAKRLPARSREGFLNVFPDLRAQPSDPAQPDEYLLLADIDAFAKRARAGQFDDEDHGRVRYDDPFDDD